MSTQTTTTTTVGKPVIALLCHQVKAYKYFLKSAQRGHINGGIELAEIWTRGIPGYVARQPSEAVL